MRVAMLALAVVLAIPGPVAAGPFEDNQRKAADQMATVGEMLRNGEGGAPPDYATAMVFFRKAADQGNASAQFSIGRMYYSGQGVPKDDVQAVQWYRKAADQGYAVAQIFLGGMYRDGQGVPQDYALAVQWQRKAADQGNDLAQTNLGFM